MAGHTRHTGRAPPPEHLSCLVRGIEGQIREGHVSKARLCPRPCLAGAELSRSVRQREMMSASPRRRAGAGPSRTLPGGPEDWLLPSYRGLFVFSLLSSPFSKNVGFFIPPSLSFFLKCSAFCSRPEAAGVPPQDRDFTHRDSCVPEQSGLPILRHIARGSWEGLLEALVTTGHQCMRRS